MLQVFNIPAWTWLNLNLFGSRWLVWRRISECQSKWSCGPRLDNAQMEAIRMLTNRGMDSGSPFAALLVGHPGLAAPFVPRGRDRTRPADRRQILLAESDPAGTAAASPNQCKISGRSDPLFSGRCDHVDSQRRPRLSARSTSPLLVTRESLPAATLLTKSPHLLPTRVAVTSVHSAETARLTK